MNNCSFVGRITNDLEFNETTATPFVKFSIAVKRTKEKADFINCIAWNKSAEYLYSFASKGSMISVIGRLEQSSYTDKNNNKRTSYEVCVNSLQILPAPKKSDNQKDITISDDTDLPF